MANCLMVQPTMLRNLAFSNVELLSFFKGLLPDLVFMVNIQVLLLYQCSPQKGISPTICISSHLI